MRKNAKQKKGKYFMETKHRTKTEIEDEYANLCAKVGDCRVKIGAIEYEEKKAMGRIAELGREMSQINGAAMPAAVVPKKLYKTCPEDGTQWDADIPNCPTCQDRVVTQ